MATHFGYTVVSFLRDYYSTELIAAAQFGSAVMLPCSCHALARSRRVPHRDVLQLGHQHPSCAPGAHLGAQRRAVQRYEALHRHRAGHLHLQEGKEEEKRPAAGR